MPQGASQAAGGRKPISGKPVHLHHLLKFISELPRPPLNTAPGDSQPLPLSPAPDSPVHRIRQRKELTSYRWTEIPLCTCDLLAWYFKHVNSKTRAAV